MSDDRELRRAIGLSTALSVPTWGLFYFVGTCVWAYYRVHRNAAVDQLMQEGQADDGALPVAAWRYPIPGNVRTLIFNIQML